MSIQEAALTCAQDFQRFVEIRDKAGINRSLANHVRQVFPMASGGWTGLGAIYEGKDEVLAYYYGLLDKFDRLVWINPVWTVSADGSRVFMEAKSDAVATHSKASYSNTYVTRFDIKDGLITQIFEYAIAELFIALGTQPTETERRAIQRAQDLGPSATV